MRKVTTSRDDQRMDVALGAVKPEKFHNLMESLHQDPTTVGGKKRMKLRRCALCVKKHRACTRNPQNQDGPCLRCQRFGVECISVLPSPTVVNRGRRQTGSRIELARILFGGEPLSERPQAKQWRRCQVQAGLPSQATTDHELRFDKQLSSSPFSDAAMGSQDTRASSAENSMRRFELAGQLRVDLIEFGVMKTIDLGQEGALWMPALFPNNTRGIREHMINSLTEFLRLFHWGGRNPKSSVLGFAGELQTHLYVLAGVNALRGFGGPVPGPESLKNEFAIERGSIQECQIAANKKPSDRMASDYLALGQTRRELARRVTEDCLRCIKATLLNTTDWPSFTPHERQLAASSITWSIISLESNGQNVTQKDLEFIWGIAVREVQWISHDPSCFETLRALPVVMVGLDRMIRTDAKLACTKGKMADMSDQLVLDVMNTLHPPEFAKLALSIDSGETSIPIPKDRKEQGLLLWATSMACDRMMGVCAFSSRSASISQALNVLERMFNVLMRRERWRRQSCDDFRPGVSPCSRCDSPFAPCRAECAQEETTIKEEDRCAFAGNVFRVFSLLEGLSARLDFGTGSTQELTRWEKTRDFVKVVADKIMWELVHRLVRPVSSEDMLDASRKSYHAAFHIFNAFDCLPSGGIQYLVQAASQSKDKGIVDFRRTQIEGIRRILIYSSSGATAFPSRLENLNRSIEAETQKVKTNLTRTNYPNNISISEEAFSLNLAPETTQLFIDTIIKGALDDVMNH